MLDIVPGDLHQRVPDPGTGDEVGRLATTMNLMLDRRIFDSPRDPAFGLCFPCMGRGPYFYGGVDRDLEAITRRFPGLPLIGFYGNGEFAHLDDGNRLLQYATVLALHYPGAD